MEHEPAAVQVHDDAGPRALRPVEPDRHAVGVEVAHLGDVLARLGERSGAVGRAGRHDVVALGPHRGLGGRGLDRGAGLGEQRHQRVSSASRPLSRTKQAANPRRTRRTIRGRDTTWWRTDAAASAYATKTR